jgi:hypothetical protein
MKTLALCAAGAAAIVVIGCGDDEDKKQDTAAPPAAVVLQLTGSKKDPKMQAPSSVKAGPAQITFKNTSQIADGAQLVKVEGNHSPQEVLKAGNAWGDKGKPLPDWLTLAGGVGNAEPGQTLNASQKLEAGNYLAIALEGNAYAPMKVTGSGTGSAPPTSASKITAVEYSFKSTGLKAGKQRVEFDNMGKQPHFIVGGPLKPGTTIEQARKSFQKESGPPPFDEKEAFNTAVLEGGQNQVADLDLKKGKYVFVCFIPDRQGGPPHAVKGMVSEATVN